MPTEHFLQGIPLSGKEEILKKPENAYIAARVIEISCLLDFLLENGWLKQESLQGPIIDLGTGNGVGPLALRQYTLGYLAGVDYQTEPWFMRCRDISTPEIIKAAGAGFRHKDIYEFLRMYPFNSALLVTAFYSVSGGWRTPSHIPGYRYASTKEKKEVLDEIGKILDPGGQLLFTSDDWDIPKPSWAAQSTELIGEGSDTENVLVLPVPSWVKSTFGDIPPQLQYNYLEPEIYETNGEKIALLRDRIVQIYTKFNPNPKPKSKSWGVLDGIYDDRT